MAEKPKQVKLKVAEAVQDDVNKGIVRVDSALLREIDARPGDILEIVGGRSTVAIVDRGFPGDIGLNVMRMDGLTRRNASTSIGEEVTIRKADVKIAKKVTIAPARKGIVIKANVAYLASFKSALLGRALGKGDILSPGGTGTRRTTMTGSPLYDDIYRTLNEMQSGTLGFSDLKFIVADTNPKGGVIITEGTEIALNPEAVEVEEETPIEVSYEDIGGLEEEIRKIREMVELPLKHPEIFERLGIEPPKGVLLHGPPGTGKTMLAKAVASETNSHFLVINGPEIMSKFYGQSEENLRKKFEEAEKNAPAIIFIDEIDAIATKREETKGEVERRVVAQLLTLMDGLHSRGKVVVIGATNVPNVLDPALRRPGRFDRELEINAPNKIGRHTILKIHTRSMPMDNWDASAAGQVLVSLLGKKEHKIADEISETTTKITLMQTELEGHKKKLDIINEEIKELEKRRKTATELLIEKILTAIGLKKDEMAQLHKKALDAEKVKVQLETRLRMLNANIVIAKKRHSEISTNKELVVQIVRYVGELRQHSVVIEDEARKTFVEREIASNSSQIVEIVDDLEKIQVIGSEYYEDVRKESVAIMLHDLAAVTHGFVGADLAALAREGAMTALRRVLPTIKYDSEDPLPPEMLERLKIQKHDFTDALKLVRPSALREVYVEVPNVKWTDVGGLDDVKERLKEAVEWPLKHPEVFTRLGTRPPKGILLYGPPGTGKTMLAKAVANEGEANFISIKGPELLSKWVGESEKGVRDIFKKARQASPCIIFFDEIDSLAPKRSGGADSHVTERVVNQILTEIDGIEPSQDIVIIGATNRPDLLDTALLRPGRFDRIILTPVPDKKSRLEIFKVHTKGMPLDGVALEKVADRTEGYAGADIEAVCREAAMSALRESMEAKTVGMKHFETALKIVRPSVTKDIEKDYAALQEKFSQARAAEMQENKPNYFG